jgi:hypothetical protein
MKMSETKTEAMGICKNNIQIVRMELDQKIGDQVSEFKYQGNTISFHNKDVEFKIQTYIKMSGIMRQTFGKPVSRETQLRLCSVTSKAAITCGSENLIFKQRSRDSKQLK